MTDAGKYTRAILSSYRQQLKRVNDKRDEVEMLRRTVLKGQTSTVRGSGIGNPTEQKVIRLEQKRQELRHAMTILLWRRYIIMGYLDSVEDPVSRFILYLRYVDGLSWKQIAVRHGCGASEDAMRKAAARYMDKNPI